MHAVHLDERQARWAAITRRDYQLTPREWSTLLAIAAFVETVGVPMPRWELERLISKGELQGIDEPDITAPGRLHRLGLLRLIGYRESRYYEPTVLGLQRLAA